MNNYRDAPLRETVEKPISSQGKFYFLGIGIDKYIHQNTLFNAVKDMLDVKNALVGKYQFEENETSIYLKNEEATRLSILKAFRTIEEKINNQDNFLIYCPTTTFG